MKSKRPDGRGHWPRGKRRNPDPNGEWQTLRLGLQALLNAHAQPGVVSIRAMADAVGVDGRTAHKWMRGINRPDVEMQGLLKVWLREMRARFAR